MGKPSSETTWKRESGFVWSMLGSAIGFANILSFSAQCYKNGGGAFLIPFIAAIVLLGLPMLLLEGVIGHRMRLPTVSAFGQIAGRLGKLFGWLAVVAVATIGTFYIVLTGYSLAYAYFSASHAIPLDTATFFKQTFLKGSGSLTNMGAFSWPIFVSTLLVSLFSWFVLAKNIRSGVEKICSIFLPLLSVLIGLLAIAVLFLPGASIGFRTYLFPDFAKLADPHLWRDVFGHVFFSFSLGLGIVTGYSRHTQQTTSIPRAMAYVALGDLLISVVAGFAIFGCVGYLSHTTGVPFSEIVSSDSTFEMGFVVFPRILQTLGAFLAPVIGVTFFFCVFIAGITGVFSIMESIMGNVQTEFRLTRRAAATLTSILLATGALPFCFGNGQPIIGALAPMVLGNNMLLGGLAEIIVFMMMAQIIKSDPIWRVQGKYRPSYYLLRWLVPTILVAILTTSLTQEFQHIDTATIVRWSWFGAGLFLASILALKKPQEALAAA